MSTSIYEDGITAALKGLDLTYNPHQGNMPFCNEAIEWAKGWHSAQVDMPGQPPLRLEDDA